MTRVSKRKSATASLIRRFPERESGVAGDVFDVTMLPPGLFGGSHLSPSRVMEMLDATIPRKRRAERV